MPVLIPQQFSNFEKIQKMSKKAPFYTKKSGQNEEGPIKSNLGKTFYHKFILYIATRKPGNTRTFATWIHKLAAVKANKFASHIR